MLMSCIIHGAMFLPVSSQGRDCLFSKSVENLAKYSPNRGGVFGALNMFPRQAQILFCALAWEMHSAGLLSLGAF